VTEVGMRLGNKSSWASNRLCLDDPVGSGMDVGGGLPFFFFWRFGILV
jgi:hypothetical protein